MSKINCLNIAAVWFFCNLAPYPINTKLYIGGLFEWLLLQDIYGDDEFKTTKKELDILKFKPQSNLSTMLVTT